MRRPNRKRAATLPSKLPPAKLIFSFHASPKENSERCLTCHVTSKHQEMFDDSQHAAAGVSCNQCHAAHLVKESKDQEQGQPHLRAS